MKQNLNFIFTENLKGNPISINLNKVREFYKTGTGTAFLLEEIEKPVSTTMDFEALKDHIQGKY